MPNTHIVVDLDAYCIQRVKERKFIIVLITEHYLHITHYIMNILLLKTVLISFEIILIFSNFI